MDIRIEKNHGNMNALLINKKDGLIMTIDRSAIDSTMDSPEGSFEVYKIDGTLDLNVTGYMQFRYAQTAIDNNVPPRCVHGKVDFTFVGKPGHAEDVNLSQLKFDSVLDIYGHTLYHAVNMIRGFFASNKYRDYVANHSKRAKMIAKKQKLMNKVHEIDRQLNSNNEAKA